MKKLFISGFNDCDKHKEVIEAVKEKLCVMGFDVGVQSNDALVHCTSLLEADIVYFIDGWFDLSSSRKAFETCHNNGIPVLFQKPMPYYADYAKTFDLINAIYKVTGVSFEEMRSPVREEKLFFARTIYTWICKDHYKIKLSRVAKILNRNHTTIIKQVGTCISLVESPCDKGFKEQCNAVYEELFGKKEFWDYNSNKAPFVDSWFAGDEYYQNLERLDWKEVFGLRL